jgi:plasmid stability protein
MAQLLVRNVPLDVVEALRQRANAHGRSVEAEHRALLEEVLKHGRAGFAERAARLREETRGRIGADSADLVRDDRVR